MSNIPDKIKGILYKEPLNTIYICLILLFAAIGILIRLKAFLAGYTLWLDECNLVASIMHRGIFGFFTPLEQIQSAPPFFMMGTKCLTNIFGINEYSLRIIPFLSSVLSLPLFYIFSKKLLSKKISILLALLLFCVNMRLIYYGVEFKQYSSDVFAFLAAYILFCKTDLETFSVKKCLLYGFFSSMLILFSLPCAFVIGAFVLYSLIGLNKAKFKKILAFLAIPCLLMPFYYIYSLYPAKLLMIKHYAYLWDTGFLALNPGSFVAMLRENLVYFFNQTKFTLFGALLLIWGLGIIIKETNFKRYQACKDEILFLFTLLFIVFGSFAHIYPIKERVALYILPVFLVLIIKPFDKISLKKKLLSTLIVLLTALSVLQYNVSYFKNLYPAIEAKKGPGASFMRILKQKYKNNEIVIYNDASKRIYDYNSMRYNFHTDITVNIISEDRQIYIKNLNTLAKGYTYWFYYPYEYYRKPVIRFLKEWAKDKEILDEYNMYDRCLLRVKL